MNITIFYVTSSIRAAHVGLRSEISSGSIDEIGMEAQGARLAIFDGRARWRESLDTACTRVENEKVHIASETHKKRTGRGFRITQDIVRNDEMYEAEGKSLNSYR